MSSSDSKLLIFAKQEANQAIAFENSGQYHQAINKYTRAADILMQFLRFNKNPIMQSNVQKYVEEYINRAKVLKAKVGGKGLDPHQHLKDHQDHLQTIQDRK